MRTPLLLALTFAMLAPMSSAEACGGYGPPTHALSVRVVTDQPASAGLAVQAVCGDEVFEGVTDEDGTFWLFGLPRGTCTVEATAHECYTWDRSAEVSVSLPSEQITITITDE